MTVELIANAAWLKAVAGIIELGHEVFPRGQKTKEIVANKVTFDMAYPIVFESGRKLSYTFMAVEALWILAGSNSLNFHPKIREKLLPYSDDNMTMTGAYGPKVISQMPNVIYTLRDDRDSRQAVISIWRKNPGPSKDIPCTLSLQFLIRENKLHLVAFMRSSDIWMGMPYDMFSFTMIAYTVARKLGVELGSCSITAGSMHLYERNLEAAMFLISLNKIAKPTQYRKLTLDCNIFNVLHSIYAMSADKAVSESEVKKALMSMGYKDE